MSNLIPNSNAIEECKVLLLSVNLQSFSDQDCPEAVFLGCIVVSHLGIWKVLLQISTGIDKPARLTIRLLLWYWFSICQTQPSYKYQTARCPKNYPMSIGPNILVFYRRSLLARFSVKEQILRWFLTSCNFICEPLQQKHFCFQRSVHSYMFHVLLQEWTACPRWRRKKR